MSIPLIILIVAVLSTVFMITIRFVEFSTGRLLLSRGLRMWIEQKVVAFYKNILGWFFKIYNRLIYLLRNLPKILAGIMHFYWRKFSKMVDDFFIRMRHKK